MHYGCIGQEFYIGRYLYLSKELERLPNITFGIKNNKPIVRIKRTDPQTSKTTVNRIGDKNPNWQKYCAITKRREHLQEQLGCLLRNWDEDYGGSLENVASGYMLVLPLVNSNYNCEFWNSLKSNSDTYENKYPIRYKDFIMRSQFEVDVATVLDSLGLDYKYEVKILFGNKEYYPDMAVNLPEYDRCGFVEAMGGMDSLKYVSHNMEKLNKYINYGLFPNRDIAIIPGERGDYPDRLLIKRLVGNMLTSIAGMYVFKKS